MPVPFPSEYVVYDLETTGLDPSRDEAVEIGAMKVKGDIVESRTWLLMPSVPISEEASKINGLTQEFLDKEGRLPREVWIEFAEFIGLSQKDVAMNNVVVMAEKMLPIVGHNITRFDNKFVIRALADHLRPDAFPYPKSIDTAALCKGRLLGMMQGENEDHFLYARRVLSVYAKGLKYKLTDVFAEHGGKLLEGMTPHRAGADVYMTNFIYRKMAGLPDHSSNFEGAITQSK